MRPKDHNKTLALLNMILGAYCVLPLLASPYILSRAIDPYPSPRRSDQIQIAVIVIAVLLVLGPLFLAAAYGLWRRKPWARKVTLVAAFVQLWIFPFLAVYSWYFLHSEEGRRLYGVTSPE